MSPSTPAAPSPRPAAASWRDGLPAPLNAVVALVCALIIAGLWWNTLGRIRLERSEAIAAAKQANANLAIAYEEQIARTLKAAEQVAALAREHYLEHGKASLRQVSAELRTWAARGVIRESMFTIISIVDAQGRLIASSQPHGAVDYSDRPFFLAQQRNTQDTLYVGAPVLGRVSGHWQVPMSLRITQADGRFGGVVVLSVDPAQFTRFSQEIQLHGQGLLELTGIDGIVRSRSIGGSQTFGATAARLPWLHGRSQAGEGERVDDGGALDGVARVMSFRSVSGYPLIVAIGTPLQDELAPALHRRGTYLAQASVASALLLLLTALLLTLLARQRAAMQALAASEARFHATFRQAASGMAHIAPDGTLLAANEKFCNLLGYGLAELRGRDTIALCDGAHQEAQRGRIAACLAAPAGTDAPQAETCYRRKDGSAQWVAETLGAVSDAHGQPVFIIVVAQDIGERKALEARLSHAATHDALTGLPNRVLMLQRLEQALGNARGEGAQVGVLCLDLDGFKQVNDLHGHAMGDLLLQQVAQRLRECLRANDMVARFGGDEFSLLLPVVADAQDCETVARKALQALALPFVLQQAQAQISASVGIALYPRHGADANALLAHADHAMYRAKHLGKNQLSWAA